jgi:hypothetical protein
LSNVDAGDEGYLVDGFDDELRLSSQCSMRTLASSFQVDGFVAFVRDMELLGEESLVLLNGVRTTIEIL